jgi:hypothetical protein
VQTLAMQLALVRFDDCFITLCPGRPLAPVDPPSFNASCVASPAEPLPPSTAFSSRRSGTDLRADYVCSRRDAPANCWALKRAAGAVSANAAGLRPKLFACGSNERGVLGMMFTDVVVVAVVLALCVLAARRCFPRSAGGRNSKAR